MFHLKEGNPFKTKMATAFVMFGFFDILCQEDFQKWDKKETFKKAAVCGLLTNPFGQTFVINVGFGMIKVFPKYPII